MWFGGDWPSYDKTRIRVYVDGEPQPAIDMEMGLGHGYGFGESASPWGSEKMGKTGHPSGVYNTFKIPFGDGIRVTAQRAPEAPDGAPFWWIVRGTKNLPALHAGVRLPETARLRLYTLTDHVAPPLEEFDLCHVSGGGALHQVTMAGESLRDSGDWRDFGFMEGCVRAYIDSETKPEFLSSGLEDYFLSSGYFHHNQRFYGPVAGLTYIDKAANAFSAYRFHDDDPVFFQKGFRLTCRCGEEIHGKVFHEPQEARYTVYVWLYAW